jgi:hypothetical protein
VALATLGELNSARVFVSIADTGTWAFAIADKSQ